MCGTEPCGISSGRKAPIFIKKTGIIISFMPRAAPGRITRWRCAEAAASGGLMRTISAIPS